MRTAFSALLIAATALAPVSSAEPSDQVVIYALHHAPVVCQILDSAPTFAAIEGIALGINSDTGWGNRDAATVIVVSVESRCPRFLPLLERYAAAGAYAGTSAYAGQTPETVV